jgi:hypothetical protein
MNGIANPMVGFKVYTLRVRLYVDCSIYFLGSMDEVIFACEIRLPNLRDSIVVL